MGLKVKAQTGQVTWPRTHEALRSACAARCDSQVQTQKPATPQRAASGPQAGKGHFCSMSSSAEQRAPLIPAEAYSPDPGADCLDLSYPTRKGRSDATPKTENKHAAGNECFLSLASQRCLTSFWRRVENKERFGKRKQSSANCSV